MTQSVNESLGCSLHASHLEDGTIIMWHETIKRFASEGYESLYPREYFHIHTVLPSDCCSVVQGSVNEGLLRILGGVSESGGSENSRPGVAYVTIPLHSGVDKRSSHKQAAGLRTKDLVQKGTVKTEEAVMHRISEPRTAIAMPLEHINLLLNQMQRPVRTSTPLLSNELDESEEEFNASVFSPNFPHTVKGVSKDREKLLMALDCSEGRSSSLRENHSDKVLEGKLQLKELELQQMVQLLLLMQKELEEVRGQSDLKDTEIALLTEKLKLEGKQHKENAAHFDHTCNYLMSKLLASKADNKTFVKQLRQLLEKYENLKKNASAAKKQSYKDWVDKECAEKTLKEAKQEQENLNAEQNLLKKKEETAQRVVSELMEKLQSIENYCEKNVKDKRRLEDEASKMNKEIEHLRNQLQKARNETMRLVKGMLSIESEKEASIKHLLEFKERVNVLEQKLDECRSESETKSLQIKEMRREAKRSQDELRGELLLVQKNKASEKMAESMQEEIATLSKLVLDLKQDKQLLKEEMENQCQDKNQLEQKSLQEGKRLKEVITLLGKERDLLQMELGHLRKDYLNMSDRIAIRMGQLGQDETHMYIRDCASIHEEATSRQDPQRVQCTDANEDGLYPNMASLVRDSHAHICKSP